MSGSQTDQPTEAVMRIFVVLFGIIFLASGAAGRESKVRHDRPCDVAQDHPEKFTKIWNPGGGNAVMFGACEHIEDTPGRGWPGRDNGGAL